MVVLRVNAKNTKAHAEGPKDCLGRVSHSSALIGPGTTFGCLLRLTICQCCELTGNGQTHSGGR